MLQAARDMSDQLNGELAGQRELCSALELKLAETAKSAAEEVVRAKAESAEHVRKVTRSSPPPHRHCRLLVLSPR